MDDKRGVKKKKRREVPGKSPEMRGLFAPSFFGRVGVGVLETELAVTCYYLLYTDKKRAAPTSFLILKKCHRIPESVSRGISHVERHDWGVGIPMQA